MECKAFHLWLRTRDIRSISDSPEADAHRLVCPDCQQLYLLDTRAEQEISQAFVNREIPRGLVDRIDQTLDLEKIPTNSLVRQSFFVKYPGVIAGFMVLIVILAGIFIVQPSSFKSIGQISEQAVVDHLKGNYKVSFDTTTLYQGLKILKRELGFNVLLPDLDARGCSLVGGRLCFLGNCRAAYFAIENQGKKGSLFIMDTAYLDSDIADGTSFSTNIKGCTTQVWKENGQVYAMVY